ncbi:energy transducer TonB, partial [Salinimicrobium oceani]
EKERKNDARKSCMSEKIQQFVDKRFNTGLGSDLGLSGINRIYVQFRIEKNGNVTVLGARAPHPRLQQEAERVVNMLPKMQPGKQRGQPVGVLYSLPIVFKVQD